jgi:ribosomal protein S18 acetylase RimI-like enzyme
MKEELQIRQATKDDIPEILGLYRQPEMDGEITLSEKEARSLFDKLANYPSYHFYVAENTDKLVGVFGLLIMDNIGHQGTPSGIVEGVCVAEGYQGQGIGKQMMLAAQEYCRNAGCYKMTLSSNMRRKDAHRFYENLGFKQHGLSFYISL